MHKNYKESRSTYDITNKHTICPRERETGRETQRASISRYEYLQENINKPQPGNDLIGKLLLFLRAQLNFQSNSSCRVQPATTTCCLCQTNSCPNRDIKTKAKRECILWIHSRANKNVGIVELSCRWRCLKYLWHIVCEQSRFDFYKALLELRFVYLNFRFKQVNTFYAFRWNDCFCSKQQDTIK